MQEQKNIGLEKLQEAFRMVNAEEYDRFSNEVKTEISCSEEYERKMNLLLQRERMPHFYRYFNTVGKRVAVIALALLITCSISMSVTAIRKPIVNFLIHTYDSVIELFFASEDIEEAPERIEKLYTFSVLPENSEWLTQFINEKDVTTTWANDDVNLTLIQTTLDAKLFVNEDFAEFQICDMAGMRVAVIEKFGVSLYLWNTEEYAFHLVVKGYLPSEDIGNLMRSLTVTENLTKN